MEDRIFSVGGKKYIAYEDGIIESKGKVLKPRDNGRGYMSVCLGRLGQSKNCYIHRIIATLFIPNPLNLPEVNHKDGNRSNNHVKNLE